MSQLGYSWLLGILGWSGVEIWRLLTRCVVSRAAGPRHMGPKINQAGAQHTKRMIAF